MFATVASTILSIRPLVRSIARPKSFATYKRPSRGPSNFFKSFSARNAPLIPKAYLLPHIRHFTGLNNTEIKEQGDESVKQVFSLEEANDLWESQDGYDPEQQRRILSSEVEVRGQHPRREARKELLTSERTHSWRMAYYEPKKPVPIVTPTGMPIEKVELTNERFDELFEAQLDASLFPKNDFNFDVAQCRLSIRQVRVAMDQHFRAGNFKELERYFSKLVTIQESIPNGDDFSLLHRYCRLGWVLMAEGYVRYGTYQKLRSFLDQFTVIYGLEDADRALLTLRHFFSHGLVDLALEFWREADILEVIDERAYAETIKQLRQRGLTEESKKIIEMAISAAERKPAFSLTIHFYEQALLQYIELADIGGVERLLEIVDAQIPFGLSQVHYEVWLTAVNDLCHPRTLYAPIDDLRATQTHLFERIKESLDQRTLALYEPLRLQYLRFELHSSTNFVETIRNYMPSANVFAMNCIVEVLLSRREYAQLCLFLQKPGLLMQSIGWPKPHKSTFEFHNHWIAMLIDAEEERARSEELSFTESELQALVDKFTSTRQVQIKDHTSTSESISAKEEASPVLPLHIALGLNCDSLHLLQAVYVDSTWDNPFISKTSFDRLLVHLLTLIIKGHGSVGKSGRWTDSALASFSHLFDVIYQRNRLVISKNFEVASKIMALLKALKQEKQFVDFAQFCVEHLNSENAIAIYVQLMTAHEEAGRFDQIEALWRQALRKKQLGRGHVASQLIRFYGQYLGRSYPLKTHEIRSYLALILNEEIPCNADVLHEALRVLYRETRFDPRILWAVDRLRRSYRISLAENLTSQYAIILLHHGKSIQLSNNRLAQDFQPFVKNVDRLSASALSPSASRAFEDLFDSWFPVFYSHFADEMTKSEIFEKLNANALSLIPLAK